MGSLIKLFVSLLLILISSFLFGDINGVESSKKHLHHQNLYGPKKMFVFGDSYVDTGNIKMHEATSWEVPYGITFPGKPSGRFSDGRVSTDFLAKLLGLKSPIPYLWKDYAGHERLAYGMNFAYGGTGVFETINSNLNMTYQINLFEQLIGDIYSPSDLSSSLALVSVAGNDYITYLSRNGSIFGIPAFTKKIINQTEVNLRRIHALGVKKIVIPLLHPLGCIPFISKGSSVKDCKNIINALVIYHNNLLQTLVAKLNKETGLSTFMFIDYYNAFLTVFKNKGEIPGSTRFETPLKECCGGICGVVDEKGQKNYTLCDEPKSAFFWDALHPTQEGWKSVYAVLGKNLTASLIKA
ncbi:GDSL lipase/esterase [Arabidopsis suecica]|uniref:GDSL lipase/esterase n=1 Tax=Arabidopsis suecica TaxID=45249 RepID=A0A8T2BTI2_ARASU|nr:GDSL lipase/esterase [Arabidopsis suecica]